MGRSESLTSCDPLPPERSKAEVAPCLLLLLSSDTVWTGPYSLSEIWHNWSVMPRHNVFIQAVTKCLSGAGFVGCGVSDLAVP